MEAPAYKKKWVKICIERNDFQYVSAKLVWVISGNLLAIQNSKGTHIKDML